MVGGGSNEGLRRIRQDMNLLDLGVNLWFAADSHQEYS